jgi:hypothetical protein
MGRSEAACWAGNRTRSDCEEDLGQKEEKGREKKTFCYCSKKLTKLNSNINLNSIKQRQCGSMYATINFYSSLI